LNRSLSHLRKLPDFSRLRNLELWLAKSPSETSYQLNWFVVARRASRSRCGRRYATLTLNVHPFVLLAVSQAEMVSQAGGVFLSSASILSFLTATRGGHGDGRKHIYDDKFPRGDCKGTPG